MRPKALIALIIAATVFPATALADPARKQIKTYQDFEKSYLYKELHFGYLKSSSGYRLYKDENNNYVVALQIDNSGSILTERIMPLPKVGSKAQNAGMGFFVMDFVYGDGAALSDINATKQIRPYLASMSTADGAQIGNFHVSLAQDPWKIRAGYDIKTKAAKPWDLAFPSPQQTSTTAYEPPSNSNVPSATETLPEVEPELKGDKGRIASLEKELQLTKGQLAQANTSLQAAQADNQRIRSEVSNQYKDQINQLTNERDATQSKVKGLEDLRDAYVARFNKDSAPKVRIASVIEPKPFESTIDDDTVSGHARILARLQRQNTEPTIEETPPPSDALMAELPGFHPKSYRRNVEQRIRTALETLQSPAFGQSKVTLTFDILPDGTAEHLQVMPNGSDNELTQKLEQRARFIVMSAAPFRPVANLSVSSIRMTVDVQGYSVLAHYAEKPIVISELPK